MQIVPKTVKLVHIAMLVRIFNAVLALLELSLILYNYNADKVATVPQLIIGIKINARIAFKEHILIIIAYSVYNVLLVVVVVLRIVQAP